VTPATGSTHGYQRLLAELKRRKVFKVAAVYGAVGFIVLQVVELLVPMLLLPDWVYRFIGLLLLAGFPIAIVLAWAYDLTADGVQRTGEATAGELEAIARQPRGQRWPIGIAALVGTAMFALGGWWFLGTGESAGETTVGLDPGAATVAAPAAAGSLASASESAGDEGPSIVVLPFTNMSGDPDNEYFSDGLSEEIINSLVMIDGLKVIARTSAFAFKGEGFDVREIGDTLGVGNVLEGSVRRSGDRVRITAQLIDATDGAHLWSETYDRQIDDIFAVQEEIAEAIAEKLELTLTEEGRTSLAARRTSDLQAYDLYLLGRANWATRSDSGLVAALEHFEAAIARDSMYAPAWVGLAAVHDALPWYVYGIDPRESADRAKQAAYRAIELDPTSAEAYATLGVILYEFDWDWEGAEAAFEKMLELDPDYAQGLNWYSQLLIALLRDDEAMMYGRRSVELDPLSVHNSYIYAYTQYMAGALDGAIATYDRAMVMSPDLAEAMLEAGTTSLAAGRYEKATSYLERWLAVEGFDAPSRIATVVAGVQDPSLHDDAVRMMDELLAENPTNPFYFVTLLGALGEIERAADIAVAAYESGDPNLIYLAADRRFWPMHADPRVQRIIEEMNLPLPDQG
jgi:TolB-like protein